MRVLIAQTTLPGSRNDRLPISRDFFPPSSGNYPLVPGSRGHILLLRYSLLTGGTLCLLHHVCAPQGSSAWSAVCSGSSALLCNTALGCLSPTAAHYGLSIS